MSDNPSLVATHVAGRHVLSPQMSPLKPSMAPAPNCEAMEGDKEHAALHRLIDEMEGALRSEEAPSTLIRAVLSRLVLGLDVHFDAEEDVNGVFDQIERDAPHLACEVRGLRAEHVELLDGAGQLLVIARSGDGGTVWRQELRQTFARLRDRLAIHESAEHKLLQRTYGEDIGTKD